MGVFNDLYIRVIELVIFEKVELFLKLRSEVINQSKISYMKSIQCYMEYLPVKFRKLLQ